MIFLFIAFTRITTTLDNEASSQFVVWDTIGFWLIWIILIISILSLMASTDSHWRDKESVLILIIVINLVVMLVLLKCSSVVSFYVIFELAAIPILVIIIGWGRQPEKLKASFFIFFFTIVSSAPLLAVIMSTISTDNFAFIIFDRLALHQDKRYPGFVLCILLVVRIIAKIPIFGLHNWLPKAHVEAPVYGSIILAGILLKLGGIGVTRIWFLINSNKLTDFVGIISVVGTFVIRLIVLTKTDIKQIVAFSSIIHIAIPIIIIRTGSEAAVFLLLATLISHAFRSSGIFFIVYYFYLARGSRNLIVIKGNSNFYQTMKFLWLFIIVARLGGPPFFNLIVELLSLQTIIIYYGAVSFVILVPFLITCVFHILLYTRVAQGGRNENYHSSRPVNSSLFLTVALTHVLYALLASLILTKIL